MVVFYVGAAVATAQSKPLGSGVTHTMPLPAGTLEGDLLILAGSATTTFSCSDSRLAIHTTYDAARRLVYAGTATADLSDFVVTLDGGSFRRGLCQLAVFRCDGITGAAGTSGVSPNTGVTVPMPQVDKAKRAVAVAMNTSGVVDGVPTLPEGYTLVPPGSTTKHALRFGYWEGPRGLSPGGNVSFSGNTADWSALTLRVSPVPTVAPPARLFPRTDDLGTASARVYPTPDSQQRSNRHIGYY